MGLVDAEQWGITSPRKALNQRKQRMPKWVKWIVVDPCGIILGFKDKPHPVTGSVFIPKAYWSSNTIGCCKLGKLDPPENWEREIYEL